MQAVSARSLIVYAVQALALGFAAGWFARRPRAEAARPPKRAFFLLVRLEFKTVADRVKAEEAWAVEAKHCRDHEPGTLSYELARSDKDDKAVIIVERYADKEDAYLNVHKGSAAFAKFRPVLAGLDPVITGHSYVASDLGYTSRLEIS
mmetsp:Transcript_36866/g.114034  ORF Transcript_36866/g.114034 Transcript_36866/m.114034 type:complete len:149 (+) Transcript_36866:323-769(+)